MKANGLCFSLALLTAFLLTAPLHTAWAQLSKKERKEWKKRKKSTNPLVYKQMVEDGSNNRQRIEQANQEVEALRAQLAAKENQLARLRSENQELEQQRQEVDATSRQGPNEKGVYFRVQVGAYERIDLSSRISQKADMKVEDEAGIKKYTIGYFNDYWEADKFKRFIQMMGIRDAWIVAYRDGRRIDIKEALEGIL